MLKLTRNDIDEFINHHKKLEKTINQNSSPLNPDPNIVTFDIMNSASQELNLPHKES